MNMVQVLLPLMSIWSISMNRKRLRGSLAPQEQLYNTHTHIHTHSHTHRAQRVFPNDRRSNHFVLRPSTITPISRKHETPSRHRSPPAPRRRSRDQGISSLSSVTLQCVDVFEETPNPHTTTASINNNTTSKMIVENHLSLRESSFHEALHHLMHKLPKPRLYSRNLYLECGPPKAAHFGHCEKWFTMNPKVVEPPITIERMHSSPPIMEWQNVNLEREELLKQLDICAKLIRSVLS